jgi:Flp pilus assembly protein TadG
MKKIIVRTIAAFYRNLGGFGVLWMAVLLPLLLTMAWGVVEGLWVLGGKIELGNTVDNIGSTLRETPFENVGSIRANLKTNFIKISDATTHICATIHATQAQAQAAAASRTGTCTSDNTTTRRRPFWLGISGEAQVKHFTPLGNQLFGNPTIVRYAVTVFVPASPETGGNPTQCYTVDSANTSGNSVLCNSGYLLSSMTLTGGQECRPASTDLVLTNNFCVNGRCTYPTGGGWECPDGYQVRTIKSVWTPTSPVYSARRWCDEWATWCDDEGNHCYDYCVRELCADDIPNTAQYINDLQITCCRDQVRYTCCPIPPKH